MTKKLNLNAIRIDGGTQSRVEINNEIVADYADAIRSGRVEFPPVVVFHDGADCWLGDGFHRLHAHRHAGKASIAADVREGTVRDAVLFSLGANAAHGLHRSNADKRKAVQTMLEDPEWAAWSDNKIAQTCGVSGEMVRQRRAAIFQPLEDAPAVRTVERAGKTYQQDTSRIGKSASPATVRAPVSAPAPAPAAAPPAANDEDEDFGPSAEELAAQAREEEEERAALMRLIEADDTMAALAAENKQLRHMNRVLEERVNGLMNEKNAALSAAKSWQRKFERIEREAKRAA